MKAEGVSIVYISHRLEEIFEIADRVTVLKDGERVATSSVAEMTRDTLITQMVGRELADIYPAKQSAAGAAAVLEVHDLAVGGRVHDVSFSVHAGEILGLAGMVGAGRTDVAHATFGSEPITHGEVIVDGRRYNATTTAQSIAGGVGFLTEDRKAEGLFLELDIAANMSAPLLKQISKGVLLDFREEKRRAAEEIARYNIAARAPETKIVGLSGGNQQKALFARWWVRACDRLLILDEPTRGVDVGAKVEIYRIIRELAERGIAILMISSELPEIIGLCDRVVVMREGQVTGELQGNALTEEAVLHLATLHSTADEQGAAA